MTAGLESISKQILDESFRRESHFLSECAMPSQKGMREFSEEAPEDIRLPFAHDIDRIIHSKAFARYQDKTQVFSQIGDDHISRRIHHVHMVTRIARTIGRALRLNEDLIEAVALGHDAGHTPFGHTGEYALALLLEERGQGTFFHHAQSVRLFRQLENNGKGLNLTLQTLDGILGHNGEIESPEYMYNPQNLNWETFDRNLKSCLTEPHSEKTNVQISPSTLEGCVVRVSDIIAYLGKDLEDAISLGIVRREDIPSQVRARLGDTNAKIIDSLTKDIVLNSYGENSIRFSGQTFKVFSELKRFNEEAIYHSPHLRSQRDQHIDDIRLLFECYLEDLKEGKDDSPIFTKFLAGFGEAESNYPKSESCERIVADYIAGMTDDYFRSCHKDVITSR